MSPSTAAWSRLPEEIVRMILESVCTEIVYEITRINNCHEDIDFGKGLQEFAKLFLISRQTYRLLHNSVRVYHFPVRQYLMSLQEFAFPKILNFMKGKTAGSGHGPMPLRDSIFPSIGDINMQCGPIWNNPSFPELFPEILKNQEWISPCLLIYFLYQAPLRTPRILNKIEGDKTKHFVFGEIYSRKIYLGDIVTYTGTKLLWGSITFKVGKYGLRQTHFDGYNSVWNATSVTSVHVMTNKQKEEISVELEDEKDGECWLWFERQTPRRKVLRYILIDYSDQTILDSSTDKNGWWDIASFR
jgi:hypothetical protein